MVPSTQVALAMLTAVLMQLNGLIDNRPDLFYVRYQPNIAYAEIVAAPTSTVELLPDLVSICTCESGQGSGKPQQFDITTGKVLHGKVNPHDIGMCQINTDYHGKEASSLGMDISSESGNIDFANWLYKTEGSAPWSASRSCWHAKTPGDN